MQEKQRTVASGWPMLGLIILAYLAIPALFTGFALTVEGGGAAPWIYFISGFLLTPLAVIFTLGLFTLQPNEARVLVLFGDYRGTVKQDGFHWANPFSVLRGSWTPTTEDGKAKMVRAPSKYRVSLRSRNFQTDTVKVNDQSGNPIEIGAVVVWRVEDTAKALFGVDHYEDYVHVQSETAVRHLASTYPYDAGTDDKADVLTLRGNSDEISVALQQELQARLTKAGVVVEEARLTHLAYAPEIAGAMLRRQQAEAVIAARKKIVHGAVSMVEMALAELSEKQVVDLDEERKAAMVGNLLVILCGEAQAEPVINAGTLYH